MIDNGNRTEWSPHTSDEQEWITVKQESDLSITSMIMDRIRQHKVLLPINHSCYNFQKQQIHFKLAEPKQISTPKSVPVKKTGTRVVKPPSRFSNFVV